MIAFFSVLKSLYEYESGDHISEQSISYFKLKIIFIFKLKNRHLFNHENVSLNYITLKTFHNTH